MGLGGVAIATLPSVIFPKLMFSDRLGGDRQILPKKARPIVSVQNPYNRFLRSAETLSKTVLTNGVGIWAIRIAM